MAQKRKRSKASYRRAALKGIRRKRALFAKRSKAAKKGHETRALKLAKTHAPTTESSSMQHWTTGNRAETARRGRHKKNTPYSGREHRIHFTGNQIQPEKDLERSKKHEIPACARNAVMAFAKKVFEGFGEGAYDLNFRFTTKVITGDSEKWMRMDRYYYERWEELEQDLQQFLSHGYDGFVREYLKLNQTGFNLRDFTIKPFQPLEDKIGTARQGSKVSREAKRRIQLRGR